MAASLKDLVAEIAALQEWTFSQADDGFVFDIPQAGGRRQRVAVSEFEFESAALVRIVSTVGPKGKLNPEQLVRALSLNFHLPYGRLAVTHEDLVITDTRPLRTTTARTMVDAIGYIARQADSYEQAIFGGDAN
jgi:hypothetical protein